MTQLRPGQWEQYVYQRLDQLIADHQGEVNAYVVFDFDNTSIIHDIEDHLMVFMLDQVAYKLTPQELLEIISQGDFDYSEPVDSAGSVCVSDLLPLIDQSYQEVYHALELGTPLVKVKEMGAYGDFATYLRVFYQYCNGHWQRQPGQPWVTYWFAGYSVAEFQDLCRQMLDWALALPIQRRLFQTSDQALVQLEAYFDQGLRVPDELMNLYQALESGGIKTYIVSASPYHLVVEAAKYLAYPTDPAAIYGMCYQVADGGQIQAVMAPEGYITKQAGKTHLIRDLIGPQEAGRQPLALFGDSMGDFDMMTQLDQVELRLLFNCLAKDDTRLLAQRALDQHGQKAASYLLQGRNEPEGSLWPRLESVSLTQPDTIQLMRK
ncbi:haloacid dehalogenase-like hydrolase [Hutsoniella sourekii]